MPSLFRPSALALLTVVTVVAASIAPVAASSQDEPPPFRTRSFELVDLAFDELPWTDAIPESVAPPAPTDKRGIPLFRWKLDGKLYYRPGALAINGMKRVDAFRDTGVRAHLEQAIRQARALRRISIKRDDAWWLPFDFDYPPEGLKAPWFNAMAQGLALSLYVRLHRVTGDPTWLRAADRTFESFERLGNKRAPKKRPWVSFVADGGYLWLEHYPNRTPDHVLNAHLHAVIGLYEYWQHTRSDDARRILEGSLTTIAEQGYRFRKEGAISRYGLRSRTNILKYHEVHVWQLDFLGRITGDPVFTELSGQMAADRPPRSYVPGLPAKRGADIPYEPVDPARRLGRYPAPPVAFETAA